MPMIAQLTPLGQQVLQRLQDREARDRMIKDLSEARDAEDWEGVMVGSTIHPDLGCRGSLLSTMPRLRTAN